MKLHLAGRRVPLLLLAGLLPLLVIADAPVPIPPVSEAGCCNLASSYTSSLFPGGNGDEGFFALPVGAPANAMILLDTSGSMMELPNALVVSSPPATGTGTCSGTSLDAVAGTNELNDHTPPYDNGNGNAFTPDSPPWGLARCNQTGDTCLFAPDRYYDAVFPSSSGGIVDGRNTDWTASTAPSFGRGTSTGQICRGAPANCQTCLDTKGYYVWTAATSPNRRLYFKGSFLNRNPPKYVVARKVVKDLVSIQTTAPDETASVRFGLTVFRGGGTSGAQNALQAEDGGALVVPLGPSCDRSAKGFQASVSAVSGAYQTARRAIIDAINDPAQVTFGSWTPLAESLFNIGQYFSDTRGRAGWTTSGATGPVYDYMFGTGWTRAAFQETAPGTAAASWVGGGDQSSVCFACQQSSTIIVTDGEPTEDENLPKGPTPTKSHDPGPTPGTAATQAQNDFRKWSYAGLTVPCPGADATACKGYQLQKVAYFLFHNDLRPDYADDKQIQNVVTYAISFGIQPTDDSRRRALSLLAKTAELGGGHFYNTSSGDELETALRTAVGDTVARATSFSVANTNNLQTGNNNQLFLARFRRLVSPGWEGHLFRFRVFNEYAQGCDADKPDADQPLVACKRADGTTKQLRANLNRDVDGAGHAVCGGLFIVDAQCDPVGEDTNGTFRKATLDASGAFVATTASAAAVPLWDAGENLSYAVFPATHPDPAKAGKANPAYRSADETAANKRRIYTVIDANGDGKFTAADGRVELEARNAAAIAPLLELNGPVPGQPDVNFCANLLENAGLCGESLPACPTVDASGRVPAAAVTQCAAQVIHHVRGWDVLDEDNDGCGGPGKPGNAAVCPGGRDGEERIRGVDAAGADRDGRPVDEFWKLGDVFHSSPILVQPPVPELLCDLGLAPQCTSTIHGVKGTSRTVQTPVAFDVNADGKIGPGEDAYEKYRRDHAARRQLVLVGANDGMLHAFDAGAVDPDVAADALGNRAYGVGDGAELWAFIPPDLLPKLKLMLTSHQYFVDGNTMVRDVWSDDDRDGEKDPGEFRTLAVLGERAGGTHHVALDVTDPLEPRFRWTFPESCGADQNLVGQSWDGFAPRPPPIVAVKVKVRDGYQDPTGRGFEERWVVMVNGGYDPTLTRGRGVWMLDAWTGAVVWKFTDAELKMDVDAQATMWPVPGSIGLADVGEPRQGADDGDGFMDTATWGDMGGQLFVARFQAIGELDASGRVKNWHAARAFEEQRRDTAGQVFAGRSEFFQMTANTFDLETGHLLTHLGSGDREHLLQVGAACGPGNVLGCCQAGCNAQTTTHSNYGGCTTQSHAQCANGRLVQDRTTGSCGAQFACGKMESTVTLHLECGVAGNPPDLVAQLRCDASGRCSAHQQVKDGKPVKLDKLTAPTWHSRFYGIWSYGAGARHFETVDGAAKFDGNRFTDAPYGGKCADGPGKSCTLVDTTEAIVDAKGGVTCATGSVCSATPTDPGWFYEYGRRCPSGTCEDTPPWLDERTASGATVLAGCVDWNSFRPRSTGATSEPCATADNSAARNYTYLADFLTGVPRPDCGYGWRSGSGGGAATSYVRAQARTTIAPPPDPTQLVTIGLDGEVRYQMAQIEPGGTPTTTALGQVHELVTPIYWLELSREQHQCRHEEPAACR
jgi:type IV pilus assembly protein PilY1